MCGSSIDNVRRSPNESVSISDYDEKWMMKWKGFGSDNGLRQQAVICLEGLTLLFDSQDSN